MEVIVAKSAGFCFGVKRAVDTVYEQIEKAEGTPIYTYGPIIHNEEVVKDLEEKGVQVIGENIPVSDREKGIVIIRSHGISRLQQKNLEQQGFRIVRCHLSVCEENTSDCGKRKPEWQCYCDYWESKSPGSGRYCGLEQYTGDCCGKC